MTCTVNRRLSRPASAAKGSDGVGSKRGTRATGFANGFAVVAATDFGCGGSGWHAFRCSRCGDWLPYARPSGTGGARPLQSSRASVTAVQPQEQPPLAAFRPRLGTRQAARNTLAKLIQHAQVELGLRLVYAAALPTTLLLCAGRVGHQSRMRTGSRWRVVSARPCSADKRNQLALWRARARRRARSHTTPS